MSYKGVKHRIKVNGALALSSPENDRTCHCVFQKLTGQSFLKKMDEYKQYIDMMRKETGFKFVTGDVLTLHEANSDIPSQTFIFQ